MMGESFSNMFIAIIVAIVLAYVVIVLTFRSFITPLIIMVSLPLVSIGALVELLISGHQLGISALMGILMLVGIVLTNAIVFIALGFGEGTLMADELAVVVIGGLFSSTLLTLLVIPVLYSVTQGLRQQATKKATEDRAGM